MISDSISKRIPSELQRPRLEVTDFSLNGNENSRGNRVAEALARTDYDWCFDITLNAFMACGASALGGPSMR